MTNSTNLHYEVYVERLQLPKIVHSQIAQIDETNTSEEFVQFGIAQMEMPVDKFITMPHVLALRMSACAMPTTCG